MLTTHSLRQFTRWVALWFVLSLAAAVASPIIKPQAMSLICSGAGAMKVIVQTDDGTVEMGSHGLDCPLCAQLIAPPPQSMVLARLTQQAPSAPPSTLSTLPSFQPHDPWQARAPPASF